MKCNACGYEPTLAEIQAGSGECQNCLRLAARKAAQAVTPKLSAGVKEALHDYAGAQPVVVVDLRISFMSLVWLMVKAAFAAIPAMIIVFFVAVALLSFFGGIFSGIGNH